MRSNGGSTLRRPLASSQDSARSMDVSGKWYLESIVPDLAIMLRVQKVLYSGETAYQKVEVLESTVFGRSLVLDGKTQSTERDEHIYHEALVHPAMLSHPGPRSVFIGGGGEGGTLREILAHRSVNRVVMLDLDREVVDLCRRYLPQHHQGSFDDPRVELLHQDAREYLAACPDSFDVMVMDLVDPMEGGTAYLLYTEEYYRIAKARLKPGGILVTQSGPVGLLNYQEWLHHYLPDVSWYFRLYCTGPGPHPGFSDAMGIHPRLGLAVGHPGRRASKQSRGRTGLPAPPVTTTVRATAACLRCPSF